MSDHNILSRHIKPAARKLGIGWVNCQVLRRSYATWLCCGRRRSEGLTGTNATLANLDHNSIRSRCPAACGCPDDLQAAFVTIAFHNVAIQLIAAALGNISLRQSLIHHNHPYRPKPKEAPDLPSAARFSTQPRSAELWPEATRGVFGYETNELYPLNRGFDLGIRCPFFSSWERSIATALDCR